MIVPDGTTDFSKGNGTGAFVLRTFEPGVRSVVTQEPELLRSREAPISTASSSSPSATTAPASTRCFPATSISPAAINARNRSAAREPAARLRDSSKTTVGQLHRPQHAPRHGSGRARPTSSTGMKYLVNREQIQNRRCAASAEIGNDQPVSPANATTTPTSRRAPSTRTRPRLYFEKAGVLGQSIPVVASDAATSSVDMAVIIQQAGADIGMKFDVQRVPVGRLLVELLAEGAGPFRQHQPAPDAGHPVLAALRLRRALERKPVQVGEVRQDAASRRAARSTRPSARRSTARCR